VFPQSTRSTAVSAGDFNSIGAKLALRASVPVVPVALKTDFHGIGRVFRDAGPIRRDRCVHVRMGAPLAAEGNGKEAHRQTVAFIMTSLKEWGVAVREEPTP
jgi:1-acyl-sn-glycerol-3-phosphate acyltransferase